MAVSIKDNAYFKEILFEYYQGNNCFCFVGLGWNIFYTLFEILKNFKSHCTGKFIIVQSNTKVFYSTIYSER